MKLLDGKTVAARLRNDVATEVSRLKNEYDITVGLAVVLVGDDPASQIYVRNKKKKSHEAGIESFEYPLDKSIGQSELLAILDELNADPAVHGILVQLPLPDHLDEKEILKTIRPVKDVDGFHPENAGLLVAGVSGGLIPCTPFGCLMLIKEAIGGNLEGKNAVIIGRSNIVGKPMASLLLNESCTVTVAHSKTQNISDLCATADILIAAVGRAELVKRHWVKKGAVVIDVGINRVGEQAGGAGKLLGDVDFDDVAEVVGAITPVPGGVGPMTIACLLRNAVIAACLQTGLSTRL